MRRVGVLLAVLLAAGCAAVDSGIEPGPSGLDLPPRPREVRIDGVEPCSLLTDQQRAELGLDGNPSSRTAPSALFGGEEAVCIISGFMPRAVFVGVGVVTTADLELMADGELKASLSELQVQGFPAVRAVPLRLTTFCTVLVGVAAGQLLDIQFSDGGRNPPIPQEQLCDDAEQVANATMQSLLSR